MLNRFSVFIVTLLASISMLCQPAAAAEKTIVFASDATWPPMEFVDENKNLVGYAIDMVYAIAKEGGFKAEIKNTAWDGIFAGLAARKYDAIASSVSITDDRKKSMDFSEPYYTVRQALIVRKDSNAATLADLKGQKVGGQIGTTGYFTIKNDKNLEAKSYDEIGLAMEDLNVGRLAAVVCDDPVAADYALKRYQDTLKIVQVMESGKAEQYGFAVNKGNDEVLALINKGLAIVKEKGIDIELQKKWIGQ